MAITTKSGEQLLYEGESYILRGVCIDLFKELGPGHKESVYHAALCQEFDGKRISYETEVTVPMIRNGKEIGAYRPDFVLWNKIILEVKAMEYLPRAALLQLQSYLVTSIYRLGFLVNFGASRLQIIRRINDAAKPQSALSALSA